MIPSGPAPDCQVLTPSTVRGRTRDQLYSEAKKLGIEGRSRMSKKQLQSAIAGKKS